MVVLWETMMVAKMVVKREWSMAVLWEKMMVAKMVEKKVELWDALTDSKKAE